MSISSTINIHKNNFDIIEKASNLTGYSKNYIITLLLRRAMLKNREMIRLNRRIEYQKRDHSKLWKVFHVQYKEDLYEFCQDMRKFYKLSISAILALSVNMYLTKIIKELNNTIDLINTDNYPYSGFIFSKEFVDGAIIWTLTWGIPYKLDEFLFKNPGR